jgi:integrase
MSRFRVTYEFWRGAYVIRKRGWKLGLNGELKRDETRLQIPIELFRKAGVAVEKRSQRADTIAAGYAARKERELNEPVKKHVMTIREIGDRWIDSRLRLVDPKTLEREELMLKKIVEFFGDENPSEMHVGRWEAYRDWRLRATYTARLGKKAVRAISPRTVWNEVSFGVRLIAWGYERRLDTGMTELPVLKPPQVADKDRTRGRKLPMAEFWKAYEAAARRPRVGRRSQRMLVLGLNTWLRAKPLTNLDVAWIDREQSVVRVPPAFVKKGRNRRRTELVLPLNRWAMAALEPLPASGCVWGVHAVTKRPSENLHHTLRAIAEDAGIAPFSLHDLRRTGASLLLNHRCAVCANCGEQQGSHRQDRCVGGTAFAPVHPQGAPKIVSDKILNHVTPLNDDAYFEVAIETMRDALGILDEEWDTYNRRSDGKVVEMAARRA